MLNKDYKYTFFDVETTGLSSATDYIIQIWLVQVDADFQIIKKFESFVKPPVDIEKLKTIVWFITNIDVANLLQSPSFEEIADEVRSFFGADVVVIGHNISFDIWFLRKYISVDFYKSIDTLPLARNLLHYLPSYSQESIHNYLSNSVSLYREYISLIWETKHHDAMYDSLINMSIFHYLVDQIYSLTLTYPRLANHLIKDSFWSIFGNWSATNSSYHIPHFSPIFSPKANNTWTPICNLSKQKNFEKIYIWNVDLETFVLDLAKNDKIIIATNSNSKLQIIKNILVNNNIKGFGFLKPSQTIDNDLLDNWIKTNLDTAEIGFLIKYISHHKAWLSVLDLNNESDYQIYNLIRKNWEINSENIILATHAWLFANIENQVLSDYTIAFLDNDRRYSSMLKYLSKPIDIMNMVYIIDNIRYKYDKLFQIQKLKNPSFEKKADGVVAQIDMIYDRFLVFFANINMEMQRYLTNIKPDDDWRYKIQQIWNNAEDFKVTKAVFLEIVERIEKLSEYSDFLGSDYDLLAEQILRIQNIFYKFTTVSLKTDYQWYREYIYINNNNYLTYDEFRDFLKKQKVVVFTAYDQNGKKIYAKNAEEAKMLKGEEANIDFDDKGLKSEEAKRLKSENVEAGFIASEAKQSIKYKTTEQIPESDQEKMTKLHTVQNFDDILQNLEAKYIYIFSNSKTKSKNYFDKIIKNQIDKNYDVYIENITWGTGKILWLISNNPFILVGGYELYMASQAKWIDFSDIYIIWSLWLLHNQIINDMKYWNI